LSQSTADLLQLQNLAGTNLATVNYLGSATVNASLSNSYFRGGSGGYFGLSAAGASVAADTYWSRYAIGVWLGTAGVRASNFTAVALATPAAPTVTPTCTGTCASTWTYACVDQAADLTGTVQGATASTTVNATTLDGTHYNTVTCPANAAKLFNTIRRTVSGGTPATLGALATCTSIAGLSCVDNGLVGDASAAPTGNTTGSVVGKIETPTSAAVTCTAGAIWSDVGALYVCTASGVVKKVAIATW
jgi:hypothetical protein